MPQRKPSELLCPAPEVVRDFCLDELYPQFLFRYLAPREPPSDGTELSLCGLVHSVSPANFIVQLDADRRISDRISFKLALAYETQQKSEQYQLTPEFLHPGVPVAARYMLGEDFRWYRGIITEVDHTPGKECPISIRFVDFGNYQKNEMVHLRLLPVEMGKEPPMAIKCRMKGTSEDDILPTEFTERFTDWYSKTLKEHRCLVNFCTFDAVANQHIVRLFDAADGQELLLPPNFQSKPGGVAEPTVDTIRGNLISLDLDEANKQSHSKSGYNSVAPTAQKSSLDELKDVFECSTAMNAGLRGTGVTGVGGGPTWKKTTTDKSVQTDRSFLKATSAKGDQYDPFDDPKFKELADKYPNLVRYLRSRD